MAKKLKFEIKVDKVLLITAIILSIVGFLLVFSASYPEGARKFDDGLYFIKKHAKFIIAGYVVMFFGSKINYKYYKKWVFLIIIVSVILNLLLFTNYGKNEWGSTRWLDLPLLPKFMPSDLLKIASIIFMAFYLEGIGRNIKKPKGVLFSVLFVLLFFGIVFIRDLGSSVVMLGSMGFMLLAAGLNISVAIILIILMILGLFIGLQIPKFSYRLKRLTGFLNPFADMQKSGMQLGNSIYSVAMGGLKGVGLGKGVQKFYYIAHVYNDFIFSVMAEEFGLIGSTLLVLTYIVFAWRGYLIADKTKNKFGKYLAVGLTSSILFQAFIHIAVNIGLSPVTGITLPFISYGGTSLLITMFTTGILLNISKDN